MKFERFLIALMLVPIAILLWSGPESADVEHIGIYLFALFALILAVGVAVWSHIKLNT